ncbi:hypothetical protein BdPhPhi1402_gp02 [Bdellovibrio phage phi1402]|uniref:hypothetical protein n=1 Tax=Bdellovibrio phage phi1402 TaxID=1035662 RepID=UPI000211A2C0|nr:hypothetical protein BdPhPhi1402_gp02 [Bdellovibrio phage phi1402]AEG42299.1 hypothetical protein [Bdellovibrio phage phi1402]
MAITANQPQVPGHPQPMPAGKGNEITLFPNWIYFKDVGRNKACFSRYVENPDQFWTHVQNNLMSRELEFEFDGETNKGWISTGGFRVVGTFYVIAEGTLT